MGSVIESADRCLKSAESLVGRLRDRFAAALATEHDRAIMAQRQRAEEIRAKEIAYQAAEQERLNGLHSGEAWAGEVASLEQILGQKVPSDLLAGKSEHFAEGFRAAVGFAAQAIKDMQNNLRAQAAPKLGAW